MHHSYKNKTRTIAPSYALALLLLAGCETASDAFILAIKHPKDEVCANVEYQEASGVICVRFLPGERLESIRARK